jgi:hypothetical protein
MRFSAVLGALCCCLGAACGQKGPPLAPIVLTPRAVGELSAKRVDNEVVLQFTIPAVNSDNSSPANLRRVEVYAHTGPLPTPADFLKYGTLVAAIEVKDPALNQGQKAEGGPPTEGQKAEGTGEKAEGQTAEGKTPVAEDGSVEQGARVSVRELITEKHMELGPMPPARPVPQTTAKEAVVVELIETPGTVNFELTPQRSYVVVPVPRRRGRRASFAGPIRVPFVEPLTGPDKVDVDYSADAISLTWAGSPHDVAPVAEAAKTPAAAIEPADQETPGTIELYVDVETEDTREPVRPAPAAGKPAPPPLPRFGYNVYEVPSASAPAEPEGLRRDKPVTPLNANLLTAPSFTDAKLEFGTERCFAVRRVEMVSGIAIEGPASPPACVTPLDTFPPAAPKGLVHIANANGVSLLWEANTDPDLGGYLVLRGEAPGDTLSPLTPAPITETSFSDTTVRRGRTYVYEIVAVDAVTPPNQSAPSNRVEETIR